SPASPGSGASSRAPPSSARPSSRSTKQATRQAPRPDSRAAVTATALPQRSSGPRPGRKSAPRVSRGDRPVVSGRLPLEGSCPLADADLSGVVPEDGWDDGQGKQGKPGSYAPSADRGPAGRGRARSVAHPAAAGGRGNPRRRGGRLDLRADQGRVETCGGAVC